MFDFKKLVALCTTLSMFLVGGCSSDITTKEQQTNISSSVEYSESEKDSDVSEDVVEDTFEKENSSIGETKEAQIHFINTGNSDAILIKQGDNAALIDGGDNDDESTIVNYLKKQGVTKLDYLIATHFHADHIGGLDAVVNNIKVDKAYVSNGSATSKTYKDFINSMANKGVYPSVPLLNSEFKLGTSTFKVLSVANTGDKNNDSIVLLWQNGNDKVLLTGDIEAEIENKLNVGKVDLLKVPHHGSSSSTTDFLLNKTNPKYAVIQVGENNSYGHPHKETMEKLESRGIEVHRNDECGTIVFTSTGDGLEVDCKKGSYDSINEGVLSNDNISSDNSTGTSNSDKVNDTNNIKVYWTDGGSKYHLDPNCSNMSNPHSGTVEESKREACKKCS